MDRDAKALAERVTDGVCEPRKDTDTVAHGDGDGDGNPVSIVEDGVADVDAHAVRSVRVTDGLPEGVRRPVATVRVTDCVLDAWPVGTVAVGEPESEAHTEANVRVADCVLERKAVTTVGVRVAVIDNDRRPVTRVGDGDVETDLRTEANVRETVPVMDAERHSEVVGERLLTDALGERLRGDAEDVGVEPAGAQNGPKLNVGRCVPRIDSNGDAERIDGDADDDTRKVGSVGVIVADKHSDAVGEEEGKLDAERQREAEGESDEAVEGVLKVENDTSGVYE